jgi:hypothetical protein
MGGILRRRPKAAAAKSPSLKFGFLRGRARKSPKPASGRVKRIKTKSFSLRRLRRRSEKQSSFSALEAAKIPRRRIAGKKAKVEGR